MSKFLNKKVIVIGIIAILCTVCMIQCHTNKNLRKQYDISTTNEKSLLNRLEDNQEEIIEYQATLSTLRHTNDSIIQNLLRQQQVLNIKNKELQTMISMASQFHIHDTINIHDTIFPDPGFRLDTCLSDNWKNVCLNLEHPDCIRTDVSVHSQKDVFITTRKETIEPPCRFFLFRWFQRKHLVNYITIHEENPYIESQENVYIKVVD